MKHTNDLFDTLRSTPEGLTMKAILEQHPDVPRRTAQRRLQELVKEGRVNALGKGKARHYSVQQFAYQIPAAMYRFAIAEEPPGYAGIPLSMDALDVLAYVSGPPATREPVGYQRAFLESYKPNVSFYLPEVVRQQLHFVGRAVGLDTPVGTFVQSVIERLLVDLSWASSNLEGNTYSWLDTARLIEQGAIAQGKHDMETRMILNHKQAIEMLVENIDTVGFDRFTLMNLHTRLASGLIRDADSIGQVRSELVSIGQSVYQPLGIKHQLEEIVDIILDKASIIEDPFEQSFFAMVHLPYLQPFLDVNKRTSRLMANLPLFRDNLCPLAFLDVPVEAYSHAMLGVYEMNRVELLRDLYVWAYGRSVSRYRVFESAMGDVDPVLLRHDQWIRQTIHDIVKQPDDNPLDVIDKALPLIEPANDRQHMREATILALQHLHEGGIMQYKLSREEFAIWREAYKLEY